jgi:hypothetical protein
VKVDVGWTLNRAWPNATVLGACELVKPPLLLELDEPPELIDPKPEPLEELVVVELLLAKAVLPPRPYDNGLA